MSKKKYFIIIIILFYITIKYFFNSYKNLSDFINLL